MGEHFERAAVGFDRVLADVLVNVCKACYAAATCYMPNQAKPCINVSSHFFTLQLFTVTMCRYNGANYQDSCSQNIYVKYALISNQTPSFRCSLVWSSCYCAIGKCRPLRRNSKWALLPSNQPPHAHFATLFWCDAAHKLARGKINQIVNISMAPL